MTKIFALLVGISAGAALLCGEDSGKTSPVAVLTLPNGQEFSIAVTPSLTGALVPVGKGNVVALRVVPRMDRGDLVVAVSALLGEVKGDSDGVTCAQAKNWSRQEVVGTYRIGQGESLVLSDLDRYALSAMPVRFITVSGGIVCPGCACGVICCLPNAGQCLGCGNCGTCCNTGG